MAPRARVVINARFLTQRTTGVQRYGIGLSRELKSRDFDAVYLAPSDILHAGLATELGATTAGRFRGHLWEQWSLPSWCRRHTEPLLLSFSGLGPVRYANRIQTIHDLSVLREPAWFSPRYRRFYRSLLPRSIRRARHLLTVSEFSKREIVELLGIPADRVSVVHSAPNDAFSPGEPREETLLRHGIRRPYVLAVGSLEPRKNFERLAAAHRTMSGEVQMVIVGGTHPSFSRVSRGFHEELVFTGPIADDELIDLYRGAELFVFPSLYEGFGLPPLEAMRCGTPVLCSDRTSIPEICGDAALYVDPGSIDDIASKMQGLLDDADLRGEYRERGLRWVGRYGFHHSAESLIELLRELV